MTNRTVSFDQTCPTVQFSFELIGEENSYYPETLVIKVTGEYRFGSAGDNDAKLIRGTMNTAVDIWHPETVLLDLTDFNYEWGDYIDIIFDGPDQQKPFVVVVGPKCRHALSTLAFGVDSDKDIVNNEDVFDNTDKAIEKLRKKNGS